MGKPSNIISTVAGGLLLGPLGAAAGYGLSQSLNPPKPPRIPTPVIIDEKAPSRGSARVTRAAQSAIAAAASRAGTGGIYSTIATGPRGLTTPASTTKKTLLGV